MSLCLVANLPDGATKVSFYDDGLRPEKRKQNPVSHRVTVYGANMGLLYDSAKVKRYGKEASGFPAHIIAQYEGEEEGLDEESFL